MSTLRERLSAEMRRGRAEKGLTQADLADLVGGSYKSINQIERGINAPTVETFARIARVLDLDPKDILFEPSELIDEERLALEKQVRTTAAKLSNDKLQAWLRIGGVLATLK
jgi:transcriptional regulator with XRE-family HTH domain